MKIAQWMSPDPQTAEPGETLRAARDRMRFYGIRHLPIVNADRLVGIVSDRDVRVRALSEARLDQPIDRHMHTNVHTMAPTDTMVAAARMMVSRQISSIPVIDDGQLVGLVTSTDCLLTMLSMWPDDHEGGCAQPSDVSARTA